MIFSLSNFQIYNAMLLTIVTMLYSVVLNLFGIRDWFQERQFFPWTGGGDGFRMIRAHYIYGALYFYYDYISSTSDHQVLDPRDWGLYIRSSPRLLHFVTGSLYFFIIFFSLFVPSVLVTLPDKYLPRQLLKWRL